MIIVIISIKTHPGFTMENNAVHIAIFAHTLASLIRDKMHFMPSILSAWMSFKKNSLEIISIRCEINKTKQSDFRRMVMYVDNDSKRRY